MGGGYGHPMMMGGGGMGGMVMMGGGGGGMGLMMGGHPMMVMGGGGGGGMGMQAYLCVSSEGASELTDIVGQQVSIGDQVLLTSAQAAEAQRMKAARGRGGSGGGSAEDGQVMTMYHGTSDSAARAIEAHGFQVSEDGMLGKGVYVSRDIDKAKAYGSVVLRVRVRTGKVKKITQQGDPLQKQWHQHGYDTAWVPPDCGMVASGKQEDCVRDPARLTVVDRAIG